MNERWQYLTVEIKPGLMGGFKRDALQEVLNKHGQLGWELVNFVIINSVSPSLAIFKKAI
ncbi:DUF4177 domain-containing protein [[Pseudomonas] boreopolis]|uniref:DUF4177 domain-containing protein n=1 Tax=Xanthomonas boreopolis TaxID=86183 RepID=UPI003DA0E33D